MFRLNDAVRRYQAQHRSSSELRCVVATVTSLSPRAKPNGTGVVANVAAVANAATTQGPAPTGQFPVVASRTNVTTATHPVTWKKNAHPSIEHSTLTRIPNL